MDEKQTDKVRKKILIIDDDKEILVSMKSILQLEGYEVITYNEAQDIDKKIKDSKPDLLIIDYMLPGQSGAKAASNLRYVQKIRKLPIIMMSASNSYRENAREAGVNKFLEKPFHLNKLLSMVKKYIGYPQAYSLIT